MRRERRTSRQLTAKSISIKSAKRRFGDCAPKALFDIRFPGGLADTWFDVSKDGHFLIPAVVETNLLRADDRRRQLAGRVEEIGQIAK